MQFTEANKSDLNKVASLPNMIQFPPSVAVLIFTRTPHEEAQCKNFSEGSLKQQEIISGKLIGNTIRKARKTRLPFFIHCTDEQRGNTFGERFTNAVENIFAKGFDHVIAIGNDAPQLTSELLQQAAELLKQREFVLGPDRRGGAYLIGISKKIFAKNSFKKFSWNSRSLLNDLVAWSEQNSYSFALLPGLSDINTPADLKRVLAERKISVSLLLEFISILASAICSPKYSFFYSRIHTLQLPQHRGPPSRFSFSIY